MRREYRPKGRGARNGSTSTARRTHVGVTVAVLALVATVVAGCGANNEAYCAAVETIDKDKSLQNDNFADAAAVQRSVSAIDKVLAEAPEEVAGEWQAVQEGFRANTLLASGKDDDARIRQAVQALQRMQAAIDALDVDTKKRCGYDPTLA
ncbi:MAG TPA: hypothetical protein VI076_05630 [Actinopolymorphaceae bacterium]